MVSTMGAAYALGSKDRFQQNTLRRPLDVYLMNTALKRLLLKMLAH